MKLRTALVAATVLAAPAVAMAQPVTGPYISLGVGADIFDSQKINNIVTSDWLTLQHEKASFGRIRRPTPDILGSGAVGWGLGNGFRVRIARAMYTP